MAYTVKYDISKPEARAQALEDAKFYLGEATYEKVVATLRADQVATEDQARFALSFAGIQGFPATVMIEEFLGK